MGSLRALRRWLSDPAAHSPTAPNWGCGGVRAPDGGGVSPCGPERGPRRAATSLALAPEFGGVSGPDPPEGPGLSRRTAAGAESPRHLAPDPTLPALLLPAGPPPRLRGSHPLSPNSPRLPPLSGSSSSSIWGALVLCR